MKEVFGKEEAFKNYEVFEKEEAFKRETEVRAALAMQMEEKRKQREDEVHENKKYVQMVIDTDNMHKQEQADKIKRQ